MENYSGNIFGCKSFFFSISSERRQRASTRQGYQGILLCAFPGVVCRKEFLSEPLNTKLGEALSWTCPSVAPELTCIISQTYNKQHPFIRLRSIAHSITRKRPGGPSSLHHVSRQPLPRLFPSHQRLESSIRSHVNPQLKPPPTTLSRPPKHRICIYRRPWRTNSSASTSSLKPSRR